MDHAFSRAAHSHSNEMKSSAARLSDHRAWDGCDGHGQPADFTGMIPQALTAQKKRMICSEVTFAAQIIQKAAPTFESNLGVSHFPWKSPQALLSEGRLAATTSRQRRPSLSCDAQIASSSQGRCRTDRRSGPVRPRPNLDRHLSPSPLSLLLAPHSRHTGGYQPPKQTSPHCRAGQIAEAIWKGLRPSHRRSFRFTIYLWHSPTLANLKHLADRRGRADNARTAAPGTGSLSPASQELPSLAVNINSQVTLVSSVTCCFA